MTDELVQEKEMHACLTVLNIPNSMDIDVTGPLRMSESRRLRQVDLHYPP